MICERERAEVPLLELYVRDYSIWFVNVCVDKRGLLWPKGVNVRSQTARNPDAVASGNLCSWRFDISRRHVGMHVLWAFCCASHVNLQSYHRLPRGLGFSCTVGRIQSNRSHLLCSISSMWSVGRVCSVHLSQTCPSL